MRIATDLRPDAFGVDLDSSAEWQGAISGRYNLLLEGPTIWTEAVLRSLTPLLPAPVIWETSQTLRQLPAGAGGTLVLRDVAALPQDDQVRLFEWLHDSRRQVISTTPHPLFPALAQSGFDEALYYRLNVIHMCAEAGSG